MTAPIRVENVSKAYRLGKAAQETMLRERVASFLRNPFSKEQDRGEILWALREVSFSIKEGEVVGIIGRNGAGKSTLLKVLSKITHPTSGRVKVAGRVASLLEVGTGFHEELTGRENIYLNGSILGMKRQEVEENLDPDVLIIDEVLAVGDAGFQKKCLRVMEDLRSGGRTVLFVSHNMAAVENLCSRGIWIDNGRIREDGRTRDIIQSYMATFAEAQQAGSDLHRIEVRRGSGEIRYTGIELLSPDGQPQPVTRSGEALTIRLFYHAEKTIPYASFGIRLTTDLGTLVTDTSTWHHGIDIPEVPPGDGHIDLEIDAVSLLQASYYLSLWITGVDSRIHDGLEYCTRLEIGLANIYNSTRVIDSRHGILYFPQRWKLGGLQTVKEEQSRVPLLDGSE